MQQVLRNVVECNYINNTFCEGDKKAGWEVRAMGEEGGGPPWVGWGGVLAVPHSPQGETALHRGMARTPAPSASPWLWLVGGTSRKSGRKERKAGVALPSPASFSPR